MNDATNSSGSSGQYQTLEKAGPAARNALEAHVEELRYEAIRLRQLAADREAEFRATLQQSNQHLGDLQRHTVGLENDLSAITQSAAWRFILPFGWLFRDFRRAVRSLRRGLLTTAIDHAPTRQGPGLSSTAPSIDSSRRPEPAVPAEAPKLRTTVEHFSERIQNIEKHIAHLTAAVDQERHRTDFALLGTEGLKDEIELFHRARAQSDYRSVFSEENPLVSICVATMNRSDLLIERCLKSLLSQSYRNIQINVVGDHCTDDTGSRIADLRDDRISFRNLSSRGPYPPPGVDRWRVAGTNSMNAALSMCEGQFITHLDDDDSVAVDRIEALVNSAQEHKADFCWHPFWHERKDGTWDLLGNGRFELGQITTGSIFYHRYFKKFPWDVFAYRTQEPGDWNRLRKIRLLRPNLHFLDRPLLFHYTEGNQPPFVRFAGESFLE